MHTLYLRNAPGERRKDGLHILVLIALIGITPKVLRELGIILYIVLKYKRRH